MSLLIDIFGFVSVLLHGLGLTALALTLGGIVFMRWITLPYAQRLYSPAVDLHARCRRLLLISALALAMISLATVALKVSILVETMELPLSAALGANFAIAGSVLAGASLAIAVVSWPRLTPNHTPLLTVLGLVVLGAAATLTHAAGRVEQQIPLSLASALHQAGAAAWIGGIPYFLVALARTQDADAWRFIGTRFSRISMLSVAAIAISGLIMAFVYIASWDAVYGTAYGVMTTTKVVLFLCLLGLGYGNYRLVERLRRDPHTPVLRLRRFAEVELGVGITVFLAAASLTSLPPAVDLTHDRASWEQIVARVLTPKLPSLRSPDHAALAIPALQAQLDREAAAQAQSAVPPAFVPGAGVVPPRNAQDVAWSEYNHHWSGIFVLLIGLLALAERSGYAPWARHWPLAFIGLSLFLIIRSDPETWPLGDIGFLDSFRDPEVVQHRLLVSLVGVFGIFEWQVRTGRLARSRAIYVFPLICALGGAMLLAHSHALANITDQLLIEMTHTPLALFGITAGWSRWLELRTERQVKAVCSWLWPMCFSLVGLVLLTYREV